jgi:DNA topoisomerase-1
MTNGLHYVSSFEGGIQRRRRGRGFVYVHSGRIVRDKAVLERIRKLVIPPAWEDVWICADADGHIQAIGRDSRGRKQYRYHDRWRESRDENKYDHVIDFARALPKIRRRVRRDLRLPHLPRKKVIATVVRLLELTLIRVGNEEYARQNHSFGLTTMRNRHVRVNGNAIHFEFRGKSGIQHIVDLHDRRLAKIVRVCQHLPGQELFQYVDAKGARHGIGSSDVNHYLHRVAGAEFTAKDFRTWFGSVLAARALLKIGPFASETAAKKNVAAAVDTVSKVLGNTRTICRKCYIHPAIVDSYLDQTLTKTIRTHGRSPAGLRDEESFVLRLLRNVR